MRRDDPVVAHYDVQFRHFASPLYAQIRAETYGEDIGQNGWLTVEEQDLFLSWLALTPDCTLLDVASGSGGPALRLAHIARCQVHGVDSHRQAIAAARVQALAAGLAERVQFTQLDAAKRLPLPDGAFDALICVDAVNHLPDREGVFKDWARVLRPGGRLVFTDPTVVTGPLTNEEIAARSSIGFFLLAPPGADERMLAAAGFDVVETVDRTENTAQIAERWRAAREARAAKLREVEGDATFEGQQRFFTVTARLAAERRLSRIAIRALRT